MPSGFILRRMWRERRLMGVVLLAICLVTGFFALGPIYVRAISQAQLQNTLQRARPGQFDVTVLNPAPLSADTDAILRRELGDLVIDMRHARSMASVVCGYQYNPGQPITSGSPTTDSDSCTRALAYDHPEDLFTLVDGRWPEAPPQAAENAGGTQVEAAISAQTAQVVGVEIGDHYVIGESPEATAVVTVVGIVEPALSENDPFWAGQTIAFTPQLFRISLDFERWDYGLIVPEAAFDQYVAPAIHDLQYMTYVRADTRVLDASRIDEIESRLNQLDVALRAQNPQVTVRSGLIDLIRNFHRDEANTQGPVILLSAGVLILLLYNLVTTVSFVLEQQGAEWAIIASRGGSTGQLIGIQLATMLLLGAAGFAAGPIIAQGIMGLLALIGPQSAILRSAWPVSIPSISWTLSLAAAAAAVLIVTLPAWNAARHTLLRLKEGLSRPPTRPVWARFFLDIVLLIVGAAFVLRFYLLVSAESGESLLNLLRDPASLIPILAQSGGGLEDPFNLAGPILLLAGLALLWMRLFPAIIRSIHRLLRRVNGLTVPLALWNVERDPGYYAQLVLLLIGTLALGTASLALTATREAGAWTVAHQEIGADARVEFSPQEVDYTTDWTSLPGVTGGVTVMRTSTPPPNPPVYLFGIRPESFVTAYPQYGDSLAPLAATTLPEEPGEPLPEDIAGFTLDVYAEPSPEGEDPTTTQVEIVLYDSGGVRLPVRMQTDDETASGRFVTYTLSLDTPDAGRPPWRFGGLRFVVTRGLAERFTHTVYVDNLRGLDAAGDVVWSIGFEPDTLANWKWDSASEQLLESASLHSDDTHVTEGQYSLKISQRLTRAGSLLLRPLLYYLPVETEPVPVLVSSAFADRFGRRSTYRRPLQVGDNLSLQLDLPGRTITLTYVVAGTIDGFPSMAGDAPYLVGRITALRDALNRARSGESTRFDFFDANEAWLNLAAREPSPATQAALSGTAGVSAVVYAWDRFEDIQRDPLANSITGILFAGFWVALGLSLLDFAFYLMMTARRRAVSFAVLQAMGWESQHVWELLTVEQAALVIPALLIGVLIGAALAYLILPFLALIGGELLRIPAGDVMLLLVVLVTSFIILLGATTVSLRRMQMNQVLRIGPE